MKTYRRYETVVTAEPMRAVDYLLKHADATIDRPKRPDLYHGTDTGRQTDYRPGYLVTDQNGRITWIEKTEFQRDFVEVDDNE